MRKQRRELQEANVSFLDVISCGFGAIVLLLIIARIGDPAAFEEADNQLMGSVKEYQERLFEIRGESVVLDERLKSRQEQLSELTERIARLKAKLASVSKQSSELSQSQSREKEQLQLVLQVLSEEMKRLLGPDFQRQNDLVGGIPADSDYIIFIIDNSGSMHTYAWEKLKIEMINILNIYPEAKGIQIMDCAGTQMFKGNRGQWEIDSPTMRKEIINRLDNWRGCPLSNPAPGIEKAISNFYQRNKKISIYYLGDDFRSRLGNAVSRLVKVVKKLNKVNTEGDRLVRIHTIGFPVIQGRQGSPTNRDIIRFANAMRELSYNNGGTFIGLNSLN